MNGDLMRIHWLIKSETIVFVDGSEKDGDTFHPITRRVLHFYAEILSQSERGGKRGSEIKPSQHISASLYFFFHFLAGFCKNIYLGSTCYKISSTE
jgi:hypothetical protein